MLLSGSNQYHMWFMKLEDKTACWNHNAGYIVACTTFVCVYVYGRVPPGGLVRGVDTGVATGRVKLGCSD